ncbi:hypothetical protein K439DRAFT_1363173 [Ramaria rubella]|nr:hypothetical protein K439DRAFT_1363173 [Ramaria rubella]
MPSPRCSPLAALSPYTQATLSLAQSRPPSSVDVPYLRAQLDTLESTLSTLLDQRLTLTARLTEAVALTSPIRLLSTELLSAIFVASTLPSHSSLPQDAPVLLSTLMLVCKQWRDICLCTPDLWTRISISPNEPESFEKARKRLVRSKAVLLDIILDFSPRSSFSAQAPTTHNSLVTPDHLLKTSLLLLRPTISRWRTFVLLVPYRPQATAALAHCNSPAPMLESLTIQVTNPMLHASSLEWDGDRLLGTRPVLPFRNFMPRLRECSLSSFWWPVLTKLRLAGFWNDFAPNIEEMVAVLRQCPLLEELNIRNMTDVDPADEELSAPASSPIVLRHLRHLTFYYSGVTRTCAVLHRTVLPALERLELSFLDNITACLKHLKDQASAIAHFPLKSLKIEASFFNELKFMRLLRRLPTLEKLELVDVEDVSSNLLKSLSSPIQPNEWILPRLNTLNLEGCSSVEWDDLKVLVESRLPSSSASSSAAAAAALLRHRATSSISSTSSSSSYGMFRSGMGVSSSASEYARGKAMTETPFVPRSLLIPIELQPSSATNVPHKLLKLDLTRCSQISRERVQWLRMYVGDVVCENGKGAWAGVDGVV